MYNSPLPIKRRLRGLLLLLLAPVLLAAVPSAAWAAEPIGRVIQVRGAVALERAGANAALADDAPVYLGDRIVTGADAGVKIAFLDESLLTIGADSEVVLDSFRLARDGSRLHAALSLVVGILRAAITGGTASAVFDVRTSVAVASARSTEWVVLAEPGHAAVFVAEGRVSVAGVGRTTGVLLGPGLGIDFYQDRAPVGPQPWGQARVDEVLARTTLE